MRALEILYKIIFSLCILLGKDIFLPLFSLYVSAVAQNSEVPGSNPGRVGCLSLRLCIYRAPQTVEKPIYCNIIYLNNIQFHITFFCLMQLNSILMETIPGLSLTLKV